MCRIYEYYIPILYIVYNTAYILYLYSTPYSIHLYHILYINIGNNADVNTNNTNFLKSNNTNIVLNTDIMNKTPQAASVNPHTNFLTSGNNKRTINHISTSNLINGSESDGTKDTMSDD